MKKLVNICLVTLALTACSFNKDNSVGPDPAIARQNANVESIYGPLVGTYLGTLTTASGVQDVRLILSIKNTTVNNSDGTPTVKKVPVGTFTRLNPIGEDFTMNFSYTPQTQDLSLTNTDMGGSGGKANIKAGNAPSNPGNADPSNPSKPHRDDDVATISGKVIGERIIGVVDNFSPVRLGTLDVQLSSRQTDLPADDRNERLRRLYDSVRGPYCGTIKDPYDAKHPQIISVDLRIGYAPDPSSPTRLSPYLWARYERLDKTAGVLDLNMQVVYDSPPYIAIRGQGQRDYSVTFNGQLIDDHIDAELITGVNGSLGNITLRKNSPLCNTVRPRE